MGTGGIRCTLAVWVVLALGLIGSAPPPRAPDGAPGVVTVEAEGLAPMVPSQPVATARRAALLDARRNAVSQALVEVETLDTVGGMRLHEEVVRAWSFGYVQGMHILTEGPVDGAKPPLYRVRVRATVRPMGAFAGRPALGQVHRDPYRPAVALAFTGVAPGLDADAARGALLDAMQRCGVAVLAANGGPALDLRVSVTGGTGPAGSLEVDWELSAGADAGSPVPSGHYLGHWGVDTAGAAEGVWQRVGTLIAQDAVRLWATPRWTTVLFLKPDRAQARALEAAFRSAPSSRVKTADDLSELSIGLPLAGDPRTAVDAFVRQAGLAGRVRLNEASLVRLTYVFRPVGSAAGQGQR